MSPRNGSPASARAQTAEPVASGSAQGSPVQTGQKRPAGELEWDGQDEGEEGDEEEDTAPGTRTVKHPNKRNSTSTGRRKIDIEYIPEKAKRTVSFTKRKAGLMKKAYELSTLTGTQCLLLCVSETGIVYSYASSSLKPLIELVPGKRFIQRALNKSIPIFDTLDLEDGWPLQTDQEHYEEQMELEETRLMDEGVGEELSIQSGHAPSDPSHRHNASEVEFRPTSALPARSAPEFPNHPFSTLDTLADVSASHNFASSSSGLSLPLQQTPYERSAAEHAAAFANYKSNAMFVSPRSGPLVAGPYGAHSFDAASLAKARTFTTPGSALGSQGWGGELSLRTDAELRDSRPADALEVIEARRVAWRMLSAESLALAQQSPTIVNCVDAFTYRFRSNLTLPPAVPQDLATFPTFPFVGDELTMMTLVETARNMLIVDVERLGEVVAKLVAIPISPDYPNTSETTKRCVAAFVNYLSAESLLSDATVLAILRLATTIETPVPYDAGAIGPYEDSRTRREQFEHLCRWSRATYGLHISGDAIVGHFEIYRVRKSFIVLKEKELVTPLRDAALSPFKVRVPNRLARQLKIDDGLRISIRPVHTDTRDFWVIDSFTAFEATADPFAIESDVEIEVYSRELDKLLAMDIQTDNDNTEVEAQINWHRAVCAEMGRAQAILREGEYSDQED